MNLLHEPLFQIVIVSYVLFLLLKFKDGYDAASARIKNNELMRKRAQEELQYWSAHTQEYSISYIPGWKKSMENRLDKKIYFRERVKGKDHLHGLARVRARGKYKAKLRGE